MTIGKISIGANSKREFHDLSHDVNTSADCGFCQPTLIQSVMPNSKIDISTKSFVRLSALPCPTFGRIQVKQETVFVPIREVFEAFDIMMSGNTVSSIGLGGSYSPKSADRITSGQLLDILLAMAHMSLGYTADSFNTNNVNNIFRMFFRMGYYANYNPTGEASTGAWHDLCDDAHVSNFINFLKSVNSAPFGAKNDDLSEESFIDKFAEYLYSSESEDEYSLFTRSWYYNATLLGYTYAHCFVGYNQLTAFNFAGVTQELQQAYSNMDPAFAHIFNMKSTPENADFYIHFVPEKVVTYEGLGINTYGDNEGLGTHLITFTLTPFGRRFFKVLNSAGVTFGRNNVNVEVNKFFAYYKAWFDLYNPNRVLQWKDTAAYRLIHQYYDYYYSLNEAVNDILNDEENERTGTILDDFRQLILDISKCVYYLDADPITVATPNNLLNPQGEIAPAADYQLAQIQGNKTPIGLSGGEYPRTMATLGITNGLSGLTIKMLEKFYYLANKESVLASNIADFMLSRFGVDIRSTRRLGTDEFYCQISDVMGTVNNEQTALGEYAGKGIGAGDTKKIEFEVKEQGYIIQLTSVVPFGGYVQAATFPQVNKNDFFVPEFDSVGLEALPYSQVFSRESGLNNFKADEVFGFRPYYFSLKYRNNVANGDFSFRSTRAQVLPYSLDRLFSEGELRGLDVKSDPYFPSLSKDSAPIRLTPTEELRSIGLYESYGNYDRIFYDTTGITDNFLIHMIQDVAYYAPMKPIRKSYDAFDPESDDDVKNVEHA